MIPSISLELPFPVSTNAIWRNSRGRTYISERYKTWKRAADNAVLLRRRSGSNLPLLAPVRGNFKATITLNQNKRGNKDCDNHAKACLDFLERVELIENDKFCDSLTIQWGHAPEGCLVEIFGGAAV